VSFCGVGHSSDVVLGFRLDQMTFVCSGYTGLIVSLSQCINSPWVDRKKTFPV